MLDKLLSKLKSLFQKKPSSNPPAFFEDPRWKSLRASRKLRICAVRDAILEGWTYQDIAELTSTEIGVIRQDAYLLKSLSLLKPTDYVNARPRRKKLPQHSSTCTEESAESTDLSLV